MKLDSIGKNPLKIGSLLLLIGVNLGVWGKTLFPEQITTKGFGTKDNYHVGQIVYRSLGPDEIIMYDCCTRKYIPLDHYLEQVPEEFGKELLKNEIIEAVEKQKKIEKETIIKRNNPDAKKFHRNI